MLNIQQIPSSSFTLLSYIVTDTESGECFVIDPPGDMGSHIDMASLKIKAVINTHIHPDHTMGNHMFSGKVPILAHRDEGGLLRRFVSSSLSAVFTAKLPPKISFILSEETGLLLGNTPIEILHTPGHSPGSICLYWTGNLISGDTVFVGGIGRTDIPGGSLSAIKKSIARILSLQPDTMVWPGHFYGGNYHARLEQISPFLRQVIGS